jgi:hypothetical protein
VLEPIWNEKRETARRILGRVERVLNFARRAATATATIRRGGPGHLRDLLPSNAKTVEHHAVLPCVELPAFIADLREREGIPTPRPLTGPRPHPDLPEPRRICELTKFGQLKDARAAFAREYGFPVNHQEIKRRRYDCLETALASASESISIPLYLAGC